MIPIWQGSPRSLKVSSLKQREDPVRTQFLSTQFDLILLGTGNDSVPCIINILNLNSHYSFCMPQNDYMILTHHCPAFTRFYIWYPS